VTPTEAVPVVATSCAGTAAVSCTEETKVVTSGLPFQVTLLPEVKLMPFTVSVRPGVPAGVEFGDRLVSSTAVVMVKGRGAGETMLGAETLTDAVPGLAMKFDGMVAAS